MAELTHFYNEENAEGSRTGSVAFTNLMASGSNPAQILGSALTANTKYLIVARCVYGSSADNVVTGCRVQTDDDLTIETRSESAVEFQQTAAADKLSYFFVHSYTTDSSPADIEFQIESSTGNTTRIDQSSLFLLDLDAISAPNLLGKFYFDASDAGPTDASADWNDDANAFDGDFSTGASAIQSVSDPLSGEGTTAPTTGDTIGEVWLRMTYQHVALGSILNVLIEEDSVGGNDLLTTVAMPIKPGSQSRAEFLITAPSGGWTWQKINDLAISFTTTGAGSGTFARKAEVLVFDSSGDTFGYFEDSQAASGTEYGLTGTPLQLAQLLGSDLGTTDEYWILGSARTDIGSAGRSFQVRLLAPFDTSTATPKGRNEAEGEDTAEQRVSGFSIRSKASSGSPDITLFGSEEANNGNMLDGGSYLIALRGSIFADFIVAYNSGTSSPDGTETTIINTSSYTPSVTGNHLVIGRTNGLDTPTALGRMWVESTTTEIRTGDEPPTHNQLWDDTKDNEQMVTFQRYSITTAETFNLRAQGAGADFDLEDSWLIVVNLNPPEGAGTVYPPFPRHQKPAVRM